MTIPRQPKRHRLWPVTVVSLLAVILLLSLGFWQVDRGHWKRGLIHSLETAAAAEPVDLDTVEPPPAEFLRVNITGHYLPAELHLFSTHAGAPGWRVISPFRLTTGDVVLIDRGFAPQNIKDTSASLAVDMPQTIDGIVRRHPTMQSMFTPDNLSSQDTWYWWDIPAMTQYLKERAIDTGDVPGFVIQKLPGTAPFAWPMPTEAVPELSDRHMGYALTWFGLAAGLAIIYAVYIGGVIRDRRQSG